MALITFVLAMTQAISTMSNLSRTSSKFSPPYAQLVLNAFLSAFSYQVDLITISRNPVTQLSN